MHISSMYTGNTQPVKLVKETKCYYKVATVSGYILSFHKNTLEHWTGYYLRLD